MAVNLFPPTNVYAVQGVEIATVNAGLRYTGRDDLALIQLAEGTLSAAVFTQNKFAAAPVHVAQQNIARLAPRALLINAGNANAVTGQQGMLNAVRSCALVAKQLGIEEAQVLPFSTGVIGEQLPMDPFEKGISKVCATLGDADWLAAAKAIMTTDTLPKAVSTEIAVHGESVTITGIAKGSGMICPNMATMLSFVATDAALTQSMVQSMLNKATAASFNRITVDSDTSTNDALTLSATGKAMAEPISDWSDPRAEVVYSAIEEILISLATAIVRDGEGATKFIRVETINGHSIRDCEAVCYAIAHSPLVKTALFASDPNWGRLLMAIGKAEAEYLEAEKVDVTVNDLSIVENGSPALGYTEALAA